MVVPRPILKRPSDHHHHPSHAVHFPPSCSLTSTFAADSPAAYDRSPIEVTPNSCALPERGCPGRNYGLDDGDDDDYLSTSLFLRANHTPKPHSRSGKDLHPRALALGACSSSLTPPPLFTLPLRKTLNVEYDDNDPQRTPTLPYPPLPTLIPDFSSESEESDSSAYTPIDSSSSDQYTDAAIVRFNSLTLDDALLSMSRPFFPNPMNKYTAYAAYSVSTMTMTCNSPNNTSLASRVPPPLSFTSQSASEDEGGMYRPPPRPRIRRRDRSRSRERTRNDSHSDSATSTSPSSPTSISPPHSPSKRLSFGSRKGGGGGTRLSGGVSRISSGFVSQDQDSGCLGGF